MSLIKLCTLPRHRGNSCIGSVAYTSPLPSPSPPLPPPPTRETQTRGTIWNPLLNKEAVIWITQQALESTIQWGMCTTVMDSNHELLQQQQSRELPRWIINDRLCFNLILRQLINKIMYLFIQYQSDESIDASKWIRRFILQDADIR